MTGRGVVCFAPSGSRGVPSAPAGAALAAPAGAVLAAAATASEIDSMVARRETLITVR